MKKSKNYSLVALLLLVMCSCEPKKEATVSIPSNVISIEKGILMKETYKNDIQKIVETNREDGKYEGTEFAWINLDSLKNYIALLEKVSQLNNKKVSGVRIYFSQYPYQGEYTASQRERLLPGRETLFLAPTTVIPANESTKKNSILENVPFSIVPNGNDKLVGDFKVITQLLGKGEMSSTEVRKAVTNTTNSQETSLLMNDLGMYPPPKQSEEN
ncbi:MAG: hypothetical protein QM535_07630 [Limnohabitans sp.]|nr:hypothetical protein [Limnohabitans sp.]